MLLCIYKYISNIIYSIFQNISTHNKQINEYIFDTLWRNARIASKNDFTQIKPHVPI